MKSKRRRSKQVYGTSLIKRPRRTGAEVGNLLEWVKHFLSEESEQMTIRHLFYLLTGARVIEKAELAYRNLCQHLSKWRKSEAVPWSAFADSTRFHIKTDTYDSMEEALRNTAENYRRNLWGTQDSYVEVWCEKDAIASIVSSAAQPFGVPVFVARGFASLSSLYSAAETFRGWAKAGKVCRIFHFGDYDPSGVAAGDAMMAAFKNNFKVDVKFVRIAVTPEQIRRLDLPTRPVKNSDTRAAKWTGGDSVEIDTLPTSELRALVEQCITQHIDPHAWAQLQETEAMERETLAAMRVPSPVTEPGPPINPAIEAERLARFVEENREYFESEKAKGHHFTDEIEALLKVPPGKLEKGELR